MSRGRLATLLLVAVVTTVDVACETNHVTLKAGDCVSASTAAVSCADPAAVGRVVDVVRSEGAIPSCRPGLTTMTATEGGDGPMIGVAICLEPPSGAVPS